MVEDGEVLLDGHTQDSEAGVDVCHRHQTGFLEGKRLAQVTTPIDEERAPRASGLALDVLDESFELLGRDRF